MIEYIRGKLIERNPAYAVVEAAGIGYYLNISLNTYEKIGEGHECILFVHEVIREDARSLFGFADDEERGVFRSLISVSGVGPNTARVILSTYGPSEVVNAITSENVDMLKSVKGIGAKTAERVIVDLRDKIQKEIPQLEISGISGNTTRNEALSALTSLGFDRSRATKVLQKVYAGLGSEVSVEQVIKEALKQL